MPSEQSSPCFVHILITLSFLLLCCSMKTILPVFLFYVRSLHQSFLFIPFPDLGTKVLSGCYWLTSSPTQPCLTAHQQKLNITLSRDPGHFKEYSNMHCPDLCIVFSSGAMNATWKMKFIFSCANKYLFFTQMKLCTAVFCQLCFFAELNVMTALQIPELPGNFQG